MDDHRKYDGKSFYMKAYTQMVNTQQQMENSVKSLLYEIDDCG